MKRLLLRFLFAVFLGVTVVAILKYKTIKRVYVSQHLFDESKIVSNFQNMDKHYNVSRLARSENPYSFPKKISYDLIESFTHLNNIHDVEEYLKYVNTEGLMILQRDTIIFEQYSNGLEETTTHISWSVAKSVVATLIGIAYDDGLFKLDEPITKYLPQFKNTGYDDVKIKDLLQMSSGVGFVEDYTDPKSDINRFGRTFALGTSLEKFALSLKRDKKPGTFCHYVSIDTQVLGMLLRKLSGKTLTAYFKEQLWEPLGMQDNAEWIIDNTGMEVALGGLNLTLRDYAKLGQLYLHKGSFNGNQIVSEKWIKMATTPDAPHVMPGDHELSSHHFGYGFQWWIPNPDNGAFFAAGIYNQYIYVQPSKDLVIVKLTANHHFKNEGQSTKDMHISLLKAIADDFQANKVIEIEDEQTN